MAARHVVLVTWALLGFVPVHSVAGVDSAVMELPPMERVVFDSAQIAEIARTYDSSPCAIHKWISTGDYDVIVSTPVSKAWKAHRASRKQSKGQVPYEDVEHLPMVTIQFTPQTRTFRETRTYGSGPQHTEFKAWFGEARVFRDSVEITDLSTSTSTLSVNGGWVLGTQHGGSGTVEIPFDVFEPRDGVLPRIRVEVRGDHKGYFSESFKPARPVIFHLPRATLKRIAADIEMCRRAMIPASHAAQE